MCLPYWRRLKKSRDNTGLIAAREKPAMRQGPFQPLLLIRSHALLPAWSGALSLSQAAASLPGRAIARVFPLPEALTRPVVTDAAAMNSQ